MDVVLDGGIASHARDPGQPDVQHEAQRAALEGSTTLGAPKQPS
jgi:hypothetical protein